MSFLPESYRREIAAMLRMAIPLALAELGWMLMSVVDNIMVGRLPDSAISIGAASVGSAMFYSFTIFGMGLMSGMDTLISHAFGADDWPEARRVMASALVLAACIAPVLVSCILLATPLLSWLGVQPEIAARSTEFTRTLVWSLPLLLIYTTFRRYLQGIHYVRPVTIALIASNLVNIAGNWALIYGHAGLPALGIRGSALSTVIARLYLACALFLAVRRKDPAAFRGMRPDMSRVRNLFRLGWPAASTIALEVGVFNTVTVLAGAINAISLAAHTIALNAAAVAYMVPLGIASAAAVSVGKARGANDISAARRAGWIAIVIGLLFEVVSSAIFILLPRQIAARYTSDARVIALCGTLFAIAALFQLFDGLQTVTIGALRGAGNTRTPMVLNLVGYWVIGLPLGCWLCFSLRWGITGLWTGLCLALILIGTALLLVWQRQLRGQATVRVLARENL